MLSTLMPPANALSGITVREDLLPSTISNSSLVVKLSNAPIKDLMESCATPGKMYLMIFALLNEYSPMEISFALASMFISRLPLVAAIA